MMLSLDSVSSFFLAHTKESVKGETVAQRCSVKKVFLEILQNSQEDTCARDSFLIKLQALEHLFLQNTSVGCFCKGNAQFLISESKYKAFF